MSLINRVPYNALVDDAGTGTIGTPWNKQAIKDVLLDPIDAAIAPTYGSWTPADASGAALVYTSTFGEWAQLGRIVFVWMQIVYPGNSNGAAAVVGGLPWQVKSRSAGSQGYGVGRLWYPALNTTTIQVLELSSGAATTNAQLSGGNLIVSAVYLTN